MNENWDDNFEPNLDPMGGKSHYTETDEVDVAVRRLLEEAMRGAAGPDGNAVFVSPEPGRGLAGTLAGIDWRTAFAVPAGHAHSPASHARHVAVDLEATARQLRGTPVAPVDWPASWDAGPPGEAAWRETTDRLELAYARFLKSVDEFREWDRERIAAAFGQVAHMAYHLGALRAMLAGARARTAGETGGAAGIE